jgi:putative transposase
MRTGRPKAPIVLSKEEDEQLKSIANSRSLPHGLVNRAHIVLMAAQGIPNHTIAQEVGLSTPDGLQMASALSPAGTLGPA